MAGDWLTPSTTPLHHPLAHSGSPAVGLGSPNLGWLHFFFWLLCGNPWPAGCTTSTLSPAASRCAVLQTLLGFGQDIWGSPGGVAVGQASTRDVQEQKNQGGQSTKAKHMNASVENTQEALIFLPKFQTTPFLLLLPLLFFFFLFLLINNIMELNPFAIYSGKKQPSLDSK